MQINKDQVSNFLEIQIYCEYVCVSDQFSFPAAQKEL